MNIDFIEYKYLFSESEKKDIFSFIDSNLLNFINKYNLSHKIEFISSIQYLDLTNELNKYVIKYDELQVCSTKFAFAKEYSQILGCSYQTKLKDDITYIVVGDGIFHSGALIYSKDINKKILLFDIFNFKFEIFDFINEYNKYLIQINKMKDLFYKAKNVAIFVSTKPGQSYVDNSIKLKKRLEEMGKNVYLFISNNINSDEFMNFNYIDFIINTACPRIFTDDFSNYNKIINYFEFMNFII